MMFVELLGISTGVHCKAERACSPALGIGVGRFSRGYTTYIIYQFALAEPNQRNHAGESVVHPRYQARCRASLGGNGDHPS